MSSRHSPSVNDNSGQNLRREEALSRSLRESATRRLTHYNPCNDKRASGMPTLTSRVQWDTGSSAENSAIDEDHSMKDAETESRETSPLPSLSEVDELDPSDDELPAPRSRPSTGLSTTYHSSPTPIRATSSCSDSSDTEKRQPNFPGNRDIIDGRSPSASPSPPTQHSTDLETPSPVSNVAQEWPSRDTKTSGSLDLQLHTSERPLRRDERLARIGSWRIQSSYRDNSNDSCNSYGRGRHESSRLSRPHYSPSISSSSAPPSPPTILPRIQHLDATLPRETGNTHRGTHWRFREPADDRNYGRFRTRYEPSVDDYDDGHSSTASPQSLPPLLPHIQSMTQTYLPLPHTLPPRMPMFAVAQHPPAAAPTRNRNAWKDYAQLVSKPNEQTEFRCVWRVGYTGEITDHCGYTAKRHLVKRHIETRHLQFKDHICPHCGKAFPQRVSLMIHVNRHTGQKPHSCRYVDCDKSFSDPARRHKHMVEAHGYIPQGPRKRHRTVDSYHANANFETLAPWAAEGENPDRAV